MKHSSFMAPIFAAFLFSAVAGASSFYVSETTGSGAPQDDVNSVTELVRTAVPTAGSHSVVSKPDADFILQPKLMKLGSAYVLTVEKVKSGQIVYSAQMKVGKIEDLDTAASRATRAAITETQVKEDTRVGEVTEQEEREPTRRRQTTKHWFIGIGPSSASYAGGSLFNFHLAYAYDINTASLKLYWDSHTAGDGSFSSVGIGGNYFFSDTDISPIVNLDFGYGGATKKVDTGSIFSTTSASATGWVVGGGFGYQFFRTANVNLELLARVSAVFPTSKTGDIPSNPMVYGLRVGLYY